MSSSTSQGRPDRSPTPPGFSNKSHYSQVKRNFEEANAIIAQLEAKKPAFSTRSSLHNKEYKEPGLQGRELRAALKKKEAARKKEAAKAKRAKSAPTTGGSKKRAADDTEEIAADPPAKRAGVSTRASKKRAADGKVEIAPETPAKRSTRASKKRTAETTEEIAPDRPKKRVRFADPLIEVAQEIPTPKITGRGTTTDPVPEDVRDHPQSSDNTFADTIKEIAGLIRERSNSNPVWSRRSLLEKLRRKSIRAGKRKGVERKRRGDGDREMSFMQIARVGSVLQGVEGRGWKEGRFVLFE